MAAILARSRNTEKTSAVVEPRQGEPVEESVPPPAGHGRSSAAVFTSAGKVEVPHQKLTHANLSF
jgi:hypothetical protein